MDEQRPTTRPDDTAEHELPDAKPRAIAVPPPPPRRKLPPKPPPPPPPRREQDTDQQAAPTAAEEKTQVAVAASVVVGESHTDEMARPGLLLGDPGTRPHLGMAAAQLRDLCEAQLSVESDVEREAQLHHALGRLCEGPLADLEGAARHYGEVIGRAPEHVPALRGARRVAAHVEQREHQRGELVPEREAREAHPRRLALGADGERRGPRRGHGGGHGHPRGGGGEIREQRRELLRGVRVVERRGEHDRVLQAPQRVGELGLQGVIQHGSRSPGAGGGGEKRPEGPTRAPAPPRAATACRRGRGRA
mgnify:CR=1 FL=1